MPTAFTNFMMHKVLVRAMRVTPACNIGYNLLSHFGTIGLPVVRGVCHRSKDAKSSQLTVLLDAHSLQRLLPDSRVAAQQQHPDVAISSLRNARRSSS
jgi:hypothetical protein